jgi:hypothetical protein
MTTTLLYRTTVATLEVRDDGDGRTLAGLALPYGVEIDLGSYRESFAYGTAFADLDPAQVVLTATHPRDGAELPIGISVELASQQDGLHGVWRVSKTQLGDEVLALALDKVPLGLSIGFIPDEAPTDGAETAPGSSAAAPCSTTSPSSAHPPTQAPASPACGPRTRRQRHVCGWPGCCADDPPES